MSGQSLREALEGAYDESEETSEESVEEETGGPVEDTEEPLGDTGEPEGEESSEEDSGDTEGSEAEGKSDEAGDATADDAEAGATEEQDTDKSAVKAPASWKPGAREEWDNVPVAAQREIARREKHMDNMIRESADSRKLQTEFNDVINPFQPLIAAQNSTPMVAIKNLMTTAAGLTLGSPQQKAQVITNIMREYGVEVSVLDNVLTGQMGGQQGGQQVADPNVQSMIQQEMAPFRDFMSQMNQQKVDYGNNQQVKMESEINEFAASPNNEFFGDVREQMADLMDMSANRNEYMSIQDAYDKACRMDPDINGILMQRDAATKANANKTVIGKKRLAASSVHGAAKGDGKQGNMSLRGAIEDAWDEAV